MEIQLYNTLTRKKEIFNPIEDGKVGMYTCGFTVYDYAHIGNLRSYIFADILKRALTEAGYKVNHIENITDVGHLVGDGDEGEDKMELGARKEGKSVWDIAKHYTEAFQVDLKKANVLEPDMWAPATQFIPEQIGFIKILLEKDFAYKSADGIYFNTSKLTDYGKLAHKDNKVEWDAEFARVPTKPIHIKRNPTDFALWKFSPPGLKRLMEWESPWGTGFPGWHIECSAISTKFLGEHFDIHTGGIDHIPVHHTNEIAQNEARFSHPVVNTWMHNGFLLVDGTKMSKSLGNFYTISDLEKRGFSALDYRYICLTTHYRQPINFTWESLEAAQNALNKLVRTLTHLESETPSSPSPEFGPRVSPKLRHLYQDRFLSALADDLNTPQALAVLWELVKDNSISPAYKLATVLDFDKILGLSLGDRVTKLLASQNNIPAEIQSLIEEREKARKNGDFAIADNIRAQIESAGWFLEDTSSGAKITKK